MTMTIDRLGSGISGERKRKVGALNVADVRFGMPVAALDPAHSSDLLLQARNTCLGSGWRARNRQGACAARSR